MRPENRFLREETSMENPQPALRSLLGMKEPGKPGRIVVWDTGEISVGRSSENDVVLEDSDASRRHALFVRSAQGFGVQDLGTSNGTRVNDNAIYETVPLSNKDIVKIGDVQITFIQTRKDPSSLGLEVCFASQLKGFGGAAATTDPGATTLGLSPNVSGAFDVGAVGDFNRDPDVAPEPAATRDLDLEFNDFIPGDSKPPSTGAVEGTVSLTFEVEGLTPELAQTLQALIGKVIQLPQLRVRIKAE
jgi:predicted component of type VI protein secretion system